MYTNEKTAEVLNDLIRINNDRIEGYERAAKETKSEDIDLQTLFRQMASESRSYATDLKKYVMGSGEDPAQGTTEAEKIYYMNISRPVSLFFCE